MRTRLMAGIAALALVAAACGDDTDAVDPADFDLITPGTLTICTDAPWEPMEYVDPETGEWTGFDIELVRAIAGNLGLELEVVNIGWDPIVSGLALDAGDCDMAASSITILPEREDNLAFSDGYFTEDQSLLVAADSGIEGLADMSGMSIAVQSGTTGEIYARENAPDDTELVSFEGPAEMFLALEAGTVEGVLQDLVANGAYALENPGTAVLAEIFPTDEDYGFAFRTEGMEDLIAAVNEQLSVVRADGTYDAIFAEFFPER